MLRNRSTTVTLFLLAASFYQLNQTLALNIKKDNPSVRCNSPLSEKVIASRELGPATPQDSNRVLAEKLFAEAELFRAVGKAEASQKAFEKYKETLLLWQAANNQSGQALTLTRMGEVSRNLSRMRDAIAYFDQALPIWQSIPDPRGEAQTLNNLGWAYYGLGEHQKALEHYTLALPIWQSLRDNRGQAQALNTIGSLRASLGDPSDAIPYHLEALSLTRSAPDRPQEAYTLSTMALAYEQMADHRRALENIEQALPIWKEVGNRYGEADAFNTAGMAYTDLGEYEKALDDFGQAIQLWQEAGSQFGEAQTLNNIGVAFYQLRENQRAIDSYLDALKLWQAIGNLRQQAAVLNNIGLIYSVAKNPQKSFDYFQKSLLIHQASGNHSGEADPLLNMGVYYLDKGENQKALQYFLQSLKLNIATNDPSAQARNYLLIGCADLNLGEEHKAHENYNHALRISREIRNRDLEASSLYSIAIAERRSGNLAEALASVEALIEIIESLRGHVSRQGLQATFFATTQDYYKLHVDLLMRLHAANPTGGFDAQALQASERGRARNLLETLTEARVNISQGIESSLLDRRTELQTQINAKEQYRVRLLSRKESAVQVAAAEKDLNGLLMRFQEVRAAIRSASPGYSAIMQPQPARLQEIQQLLDEDTLLLEYSLGQDSSYLWAVTPGSISSFELPNRAKIEGAAKRVYDLLTARNASVDNESTEQKLLRVKKADQEFNKEAAILSEMILAPVSSLLKNKRLLIVAEGALQYVPFGALPLPPTRGQGEESDRRTSRSVAEDKAGSKGSSTRQVKQLRNSGLTYLPLILDHEIINLPSASVLAVLRRDSSASKNAQKTLAVLADPVFSDTDPRLKQLTARRLTTGRTDSIKASLALSATLRSANDVGLSEFRRLPSSGQEADAISQLVSSEKRLKAVDFAANRTTAMSGELSQYRIVHFATHTLINSTHPELSGIVLSLVDEEGNPQDGFLRLHEIYNLKLAADLVVLSGCQTALGKDIKGEGLIGLTRGFMYAGTTRVIASLWKVDDKATSDLMKQFYRAMLGQGMRPAAALKAAQIQMVKQNKQPYYWAAFALHGEWK